MSKKYKPTAEKAFEVLKKNLDIFELLSLVSLLAGYIEEETQKDMAKQFEDEASEGA